jgi:hypothetical protein
MCYKNVISGGGPKLANVANTAKPLMQKPLIPLNR